MVADPVLVMWLEYMVEWVEGDVKNHRYGVSSSCRRVCGGSVSVYIYRKLFRVIKKGSFVVRHRYGKLYRFPQGACHAPQQHRIDNRNHLLGMAPAGKKKKKPGARSSGGSQTTARSQSWVG